jgi:hypothetical protein
VSLAWVDKVNQGPDSDFLRSSGYE